MSSTIRHVEQAIDQFGALIVKLFHTVALFAIGGAIVYAGATTFLGMAAKGHFGVDDILLLFIYLELGAMVGIYFKTAKMPVRFLIYVAITAITRTLVGIVSIEHKADIGIVLASGAILILALATLVVRYGSYHMPLDTGLEELSDHAPLPPKSRTEREMSESD
jgi:phosphate starvation-inducible membrane PsiE